MMYKMKPSILKYILLPLLAIAGLYGCKKSFLEKTPPDQIPSNAFWKTQSDADLALTAIYTYLVQGYNYTSSTNTGLGFGAGAIYWETISDNAFSGAFAPTSTGSIEATNANILQDAWQTSYRAIKSLQYIPGQYREGQHGLEDHDPLYR